MMIGPLMKSGRYVALRAGTAMGIVWGSYANETPALLSCSPIRFSRPFLYLAWISRGSGKEKSPAFVDFDYAVTPHVKVPRFTSCNVGAFSVEAAIYFDDHDAFLRARRYRNPGGHRSVAEPNCSPPVSSVPSYSKPSSSSLNASPVPWAWNSTSLRI